MGLSEPDVEGSSEEESSACCAVDEVGVSDSILGQALSYTIDSQ